MGQQSPKEVGWLGETQIGFIAERLSMSISAICFASTAVCRLSPGSLQQQVRPGRSGEADVRETINSAQCALKISLNTWRHFRRQFEHHASGGAPVTFRFMEFNLLENMKWLIRAWEANEGTSTSSTFCIFPTRTSLQILSRTWRKYPMRPGLGRSLEILESPQEVGWLGRPTWNHIQVGSRIIA